MTTGESQSKPTWWATVKKPKGETIWEGRVSGENEKAAFSDVLGRLQDGYGTVLTTVVKEVKDE